MGGRGWRLAGGGCFLADLNEMITLLLRNLNWRARLAAGGCFLADLNEMNRFLLGNLNGRARLAAGGRRFFPGRF